MYRVSESIFCGLPTNQRRVLSFLSSIEFADPRQISSSTKLTQFEVVRSLNELVELEPPLVNRVGESMKHRLSVDGCKLMHKPISEFVTEPEAANKTELGPGPRGKIVIALKRKACSVAELVKLTSISEMQLRYYLRTLKDRCIVVEFKSTFDKRVLMYALRATPVEPAKPILTPSIVPLNDETDWHTWVERLLIEKMGGPAALQEDAPAPDVILPQAKAKKPLLRVLILGGTDSYQQSELEKEFTGKINLSFFDPRYQKSPMLSICKAANHIFIRSDVCGHEGLVSARSSNRPITFIEGNLRRVQMQLRKFCDTRLALEKIFK